MSATIEQEKDLTLLNVNGLEIRLNSIYKVTNKPDSNAPSGFIKEGTTKLPSVGIGNTVPCRYTNDVYDTGLYEGSPCYANMSNKDISALVKELKKYIVTPYEKKFGKGKLDNSNTEFWDSYGVNLESGKFFDTNKVEDLLGLYISMRGFELTPKKALGNPKFTQSQFCIEDKEEVKSVASERANTIMGAIGDFQSLLKSNKSKLVNIFRYLGVFSYAETVDADTLKAIGYTWFNEDVSNPSRFTKVYNLTQDDETENIVDLFVIVSKLYHNGVIRKEAGSYHFKGESLGADLKTVTKNLNSNKELQELKIDLIENN